MRSGVILAAGFGSRLREEDDDQLKPLTEVGGEPLLFRAIRSLEIAGCERVVVVLGFRSEQLQAAIDARPGGKVEVITTLNDRFDLANGVSLLAARPHVGEEFVVTMADHVLGDDVMERAADHHPAPGAATLLVDYRIDDVFDLDDATKVRAELGKIAEIGKQLDDYNCIDIGVFVCTAGLMDALQSVLDETGNASLSQGVARLAAAGKMHVLDIGDGFWQDVDTPEMLEHARAVLAGRAR